MIYESNEDERAYAAARRAMLKAAGRCINGPLLGDIGKHGAVHGPVVNGGTKCQRCVEQHRGVRAEQVAA